MRFLVFGSTGWIGGKMVELIAAAGHDVIRAKSRLEDISDVSRELTALAGAIDRIILCAGITGRPNIDWCETNQEITRKVNVDGTVNLLTESSRLEIHCTNFTSGCIYTSSGTAPPFTEEDVPNFGGSFYSRTKVEVERMTGGLQHVLTLRLRLPVASDTSSRNMIMKLAGYKQLMNVANSITVLDEMLPIALAMSERSTCGIYNFTNPGSVYHNQVLSLYQRYIDPDHQWINLPREVIQRGLVAGRSNCELDADKLLGWCKDAGVIPPSAAVVGLEKVMIALMTRMDKRLSIESRAFDRNILLTGGAGFIGGHVVARLVNTYPELNIIVVDCLNSCSSLSWLAPFLHRPNFTFVQGDITNLELMVHIFTSYSIDTVMHFAADTHVDNSFSNALGFTQTNTVGTHVLLECARAVGVELFLHVSTDEVYGSTTGVSACLSCDSIRAEHGVSSMLDPTNPYSASKAAAEMLVRSYAHSFGLPYIITRCNNVYGPQQYNEKIIPRCIVRLLNDQPCLLQGNGENMRHYIYVDDVVDAFETILLRGATGQTYEISSDDEKRNIDVIESIFAAMNKDSAGRIHKVKDRPFNDVRYRLDGSSLHALGWKKTTPFEDGLARTIAWYAEHKADYIVL